MKEKCYICCDLKSFYASVECVERGLDPMTTNLVVADKRRTDKTICLAVSPALKAWGIPGRPRLFEVIRQVEEMNALRRASLRGRSFTGRSYLASRLDRDKSLEVAYITAMPHMQRYMEKSAQVLQIYLQFMAPEDIHVYSVDEVLLDLTPYLKFRGLDAPRPGPGDDPAGAQGNRNHRHRRYRHQSVPVQGGHGHCGQAYGTGSGTGYGSPP